MSMGIKARILDGLGKGYEAHVTSENAILVSNYTCPPLIPQKNKIFRRYLTADGTSTGSNDMLVDGSTTNQEFFIPADNDNDRYITAISFVIGDGGAALNQFGGIAALTNGCKLYYYDHEFEEVIIHNSLKSNWDFVRMCLGQPAFGDGAGAFRGTNVEGGAEAFLPVLPLSQLMPPYGIKLDLGTQQKIALVIRDDCSAPDVFNAIAYGFDRFP